MLSIALVLQVFSFWLFSVSGSLPALYGGAVLFGVGFGTAASLFAAVTADFFGRAQIGSISGLIFSIASAAGAVGPYLGGVLHDWTGPYDYAFRVGATMNLLAVILVLVIRPPRRSTSPM